MPDLLTIAADASVDLQLHTVYSDGTWTPEALIEALIEGGFALAAITDHDRPDTAPVLRQLSQEKQFPLITATEMTTNWRGEMTDVLCFGFDPDSRLLSEIAQDVLRRQQDNIREVYQQLVRDGYRFENQSSDPLEQILAQPASHQPHALVDLLKANDIGTPERSAGRILLDAGVQFAMSEIGAVVDATHKSGGVCLLAHPGRGGEFPLYTPDLIEEMRAEIPIDGLEVYYPLHSEAQTAEFMAYAETHQLLISAGSDSHGPEKMPVRYPAGNIRRLLERLGIQVL